MGSLEYNTLYAIMEQVVVAAYNNGVRDEDMIDFIVPFTGMKISECISTDIETDDGLNAREVIMSQLEPDLYEAITAKWSRLDFDNEKAELALREETDQAFLDIVTEFGWEA